MAKRAPRKKTNQTESLIQSIKTRVQSTGDAETLTVEHEGKQLVVRVNNDGRPTVVSPDMQLIPELHQVCLDAGMDGETGGRSEQEWLLGYIRWLLSGNPERRYSPSNPARKYQCPICYEAYGGMGEIQRTEPINVMKVRQHFRCNECGHKYYVDVYRETLEVFDSWGTVD